MTQSNPFHFEHNPDSGEFCVSIMHDFAHAGLTAVLGVGATIEDAFADLKVECDEIGIPFPKLF